MDLTTIDSETLKSLGLEDLEPEAQEDLLLELYELVFETSIIRIIGQMDDATKDAFDSLMETEPTEEQLQSFLSENVPEADQIVADTVKELSDDILAVTGESQD